MYSFPETLLHLQRPDKKPVLSCCPDLDLATGAAKHGWPGALQGAAGQVLSCCPLEHLQTTTSPLPLLSVKICLPNRSRHTIALHVCIFFTGQKVCDPRFQERFDVFYMAVNCEWARRRSVCGSRGASSRTGPVYRDILHTGSPFLSLRSTRRPLISTSCLPSNSSDYRREPLEFMIAK